MTEETSSVSSLTEDSVEYVHNSVKPVQPESKCSTKLDTIDDEPKETVELDITAIGFQSTDQNEGVTGQIFVTPDEPRTIYIERPVVVKEFQPSRKLIALDVLLNFTWIAMLTVAFWRGTWEIMDMYVYPQHKLFSAILCAPIGCAVCFFLNLASPLLHDCLANTDHSYLLVCASFHAYIFSVATVAQWRGGWYLLDECIPLTWEQNSASAAIAIVCLWLLRSSITAVTPPFAVNITPRDEFYLPLPRFRTSSASPCLYGLDHAFSQVVIISLCITLWRGIWNVYSITIFPENHLVSSLLNLSCACVLILCLLMVENTAAKVSECLASKFRILQLLFEDWYVFLAILGSVGYWRGAWMLIAERILPEKDVGPWLCHAVGYIFLALTLATDTLSHRSIVVDAELTGGIHWPLEYVRALLKQNTATWRLGTSL